MYVYPNRNKQVNLNHWSDVNKGSAMIYLTETWLQDTDEDSTVTLNRVLVLTDRQVRRERSVKT